MAELDEHVGKRLPSYMVPASTQFVEAMPMTANGKVDVRALPDPFAVEVERTGVVVRDEVATAVTEIWSQTLELPVERIGGADFNELGGNSVLLLSMLAAVSSRVVGPAGEGRFMAELSRIIREPTVDNISELAREARKPVAAVEV